MSSSRRTGKSCAISSGEAPVMNVSMTVARVTRVPATRMTPSASVARGIGSRAAAFNMGSGYQTKPASVPPHPRRLRLRPHRYRLRLPPEQPPGLLPPLDHDFVDRRDHQQGEHGRGDDAADYGAA